MIDLSFLTEEEQETILAVLKRDAELKKAEEQRVRGLQKTVSDRGQLRYMTGEWFYETKQLRHQDRIHGTDIIRASMRHTQKPLTILELSQTLPEKSSFISSENKEVFVPPVLCGLLQQPQEQLNDEMYEKQNPFETPQDTPKPLVQSPTKLRKNPFDSEVNVNHTYKEKDSKLLDGAVDQTQAKSEGPLASSESCISFASDFKQDPKDSPVTHHNASVPMPMPQNRPFSTSSQDCFAEVDKPGGRLTNSVALHGILKHVSTPSSTDSLSSHLDLQSPVSLHSPTETWIDRKQVRFSSMVGQSRVEWPDGKEVGEHSLLDSDFTPAEAENISKIENAVSVSTCRPLLSQSPLDSLKGELNCKNEGYLQEQEVFDDVSEHCRLEFLNPEVSGLVSAEKESGKPVHPETEPEEDCQSEAKDWPTGRNLHQLPKQSTDTSVEATLDTQPSTNGSSKGSSHAVSQKLLGFFRREKDKNTRQSPEERQVKILKQKEPGKNLDLSQGAADTTMYNPTSVKEETMPFEMMQVKTLQHSGLQNIPFKETKTSVDADTQEATDGRVVAERLSNMKAFWESDNSSPKILFTREEARPKDINKTFHDPQTNSDVENNESPQMEMTAADTSKKKNLPQTDPSLFVYLCEEDGTYRANPVIIYDETDDCLTASVSESQFSEPEETIISPVPYSVVFNTPKQEGNMPVPLPRLSSRSPQNSRPAKISEFRNVREKDYTEPRVTATRINEASSCSTFIKKVIPSQSDLRTTLDSKEKSEEEAQISPHKTKSNVAFKSLKVTVKGFVSQSPDKTQLSSLCTGDVQSTCHQVKADTEALERPLSPNKSHTPRLKHQDDEIRRSPSKTCHPRVLPRESTSPKRSRQEGSLLTAFPINIEPQTKVADNHNVKPTPVLRQKISPSKDAEQKVIKETTPSTDICSGPLPLNLEDRGTCFGNMNSSNSISPLSKKASEKMTCAHLARSYIPQDYQHYLGPHEKAYVPALHQEKAAAAESCLVHRPQNILRESAGNQSDSLTDENAPRISSWIVSNKCGNSSQDTTTRACSLFRESSNNFKEANNPIGSVLKSSRSTSSSKSLENLTSQTIFSPPSASTHTNSEQMKAGVSVPAFQQYETDSDSTFETNLGVRRNTGSSMSNISLSSGMASMSSVSGSISSIYPADFGDIEVQGSIQFAMNYIQQLTEFHIFVVHCRDLSVADTKKNRSDPYVKCYLLPDKTKLGKRKTAVKKKTLNPTYNEILRFKIKMEELKTQNLNISVWHNDTFGRNSFLGEVDVDMSDWDFSNTQINEYALKARVSAQTPTSSPSRLMDSRGQMRLALRFLPQMSHTKTTPRMETGEVQIWVKDCKNLPPVRGVIIDPFVKCTILPDTSRKSRQKTRVVKRTANPMFNHTMVYDGFQPEDLREACVEITVWDHDRLHNHYIGGLRLGLGSGRSYGIEVLWMDSTTDEANLWQRMLQSDGEWVEDVLPLRMLLIAKSMPK